MMKNKFGICRGRIYKKVSASRFTFALHSSVKEFLLKSLRDPEVADVLTPYIGSVTSLLSEPACGLLTPLKIDHDVIEVNPAGFCFHISQKKFLHHDKMKNGMTPRAFIPYHYMEDRVPYPLAFIHGENILKLLKRKQRYCHYISWRR